MNRKKTVLFTTILTTLAAGSASAVTLASTSFDGRVLTTVTTTNDTASSLNWTLNGLEDPGNMSAFNAAASGQTIFDANSLTQNIFAPGLNTGNGNTFWTTSINLTVSAGSAVSLTDITFNYVAVNGSQAENVNRLSDFTVTLRNPSSAVVGSVTVPDVNGGTAAGQPLVTATFSSAIALSDPGTYTLEIKGGDFIGFNETGNHTAIDNLSINGTVVPEPSALLLSGIGLLALFRRRR